MPGKFSLQLLLTTLSMIVPDDIVPKRLIMYPVVSQTLSRLACRWSSSTPGPRRLPGRWPPPPPPPPPMTASSTTPAAAPSLASSSGTSSTPTRASTRVNPPRPTPSTSPCTSSTGRSSPSPPTVREREREHFNRFAANFSQQLLALRLRFVGNCSPRLRANRIDTNCRDEGVGIS